ncbi:HTH-type transcriptional regulator CfxR [Cupriavidus necator]|uniref:HTH-type transcriptional regulator CfxR n=2 Tax=Cupriavidus necator (strain ATCC 17699 / DSM 428 / KCTC 22496 / NCIMB 10442 / H16 / Stanier 337) TaxID=381666 RepID=CFXR_CUPNH|nr:MULTISPECIES: LysR family transcriptional regulator [Cupriavidus]P42722.1 RecName: Full=HTH-type transcriptional regulator CfxR; AltName: Full=RuBisCO operon transcriptional regulator [Cupriavidus necator H16]AAA21982.1 ribulose-1,5-bisphosphate carboxylase/oxygenase large subunit [Cupriavidus necator H16]EON21392.1 transcription regulator LysR [Cupriavidus sp. GA3-3]KUE89990.1 transcriptional regulator [Cupriavidus necator]QCC04044.1 LysR family transcriptional regulator [Cupriavidus necat
MSSFLRALTLRQLQIFVTVARHASFVRAAEELHLTQPAVSMQVKQLESVVGMALFERVKGQLTLTEPGDRLLHHASRILGEVKDAEEGLQAVKDVEQGSITIGLISTSKYFAPKLLAGFTALHPGVDLRIAEGNRETLLRLLQDNAIDLALMGRPPRELDAVSEPIAAHPHVLVASPRHPLHDAKGFDLQELRHETFLLREPGSGTRTVAEYMFRDHLFTPAKVITLGSNETIKQAVMAGMGISLLSLHTLGLELRTGEIGLLDVAGTPIERIWHVAHMSSKRLSPASESCRAYLLEHTAEFLGREYGGLMPGRRVA